MLQAGQTPGAKPCRISFSAGCYRLDMNERLGKEHTDLLRLRGQVAAMRNLNEELAKLRAAESSGQRPAASGGGPFIPAARVVDAGLATPEAAVQALAWEIINGHQERFNQGVDFDTFKEVMHEARAFQDS